MLMNMKINDMKINEHEYDSQVRITLATGTM